MSTTQSRLNSSARVCQAALREHFPQLDVDFLQIYIYYDRLIEEGFFNDTVPAASANFKRLEAELATDGYRLFRVIFQLFTVIERTWDKIVELELSQSLKHRPVSTSVREVNNVFEGFKNEYSLEDWPNQFQQMQLPNVFIVEKNLHVLHVGMNEIKKLRAATVLEGYVDGVRRPLTKHDLDIFENAKESLALCIDENLRIVWAFGEKRKVRTEAYDMARIFARTKPGKQVTYRKLSKVLWHGSWKDEHNRKSIRNYVQFIITKRLWPDRKFKSVVESDRGDGYRIHDSVKLFLLKRRE